MFYYLNSISDYIMSHLKRSSTFEISNPSLINDIDVFCENPNKMSKFEISRLVLANGFVVKGPINTREIEYVNKDGKKSNRYTVKMNLTMVDNLPAYQILMRNQKIYMYSHDGKELSLMKNKSIHEIQEYKKSINNK